MDAMKSALKKHILRSKAHAPSLKTDVMDDKDRGDKAPEVKDAGGDMDADDQMGALQMVSDKVTHPGRGPMTLDERAAGSAKEKKASIMKHKKKI